MVITGCSTTLTVTTAPEETWLKLQFKNSQRVNRPRVLPRIMAELYNHDHKLYTLDDVHMLDSKQGSLKDIEDISGQVRIFADKKRDIVVNWKWKTIDKLS
jgi:hypothetical protein